MCLLQKSADSKVRKITFPKNQPQDWPTVLQVDDQPTFSLFKYYLLFFNFNLFLCYFESIVKAQPSITISCVAAKNVNMKNTAVRRIIS
jgi:hypothetical protein